eukprot:TRINITY_DN90798_c0_g1_i1.p1 TRINITY_DN90798_c0_g1~~TRINITY_DN90798_c0_g1_i1.p1  ORF type:complete len:150 (-),score=29.16 TRINITY_DN90798_c0_g1_i1:284-679(-)
MCLAWLLAVLAAATADSAKHTCSADGGKAYSLNLLQRGMTASPVLVAGPAKLSEGQETAGMHTETAEEEFVLLELEAEQATRSVFHDNDTFECARLAVHVAVFLACGLAPVYLVSGKPALGFGASKPRTTA